MTDSLYMLAVPYAGSVDPVVSTITAAIAIPLSVVAIFFGYMFFRFFVGTVAAVSAGVAVIFALKGGVVSCDVLSWTAPAAGVVAFGLGMCIASRAVCLLGVFVGGALPYVIFMLFPSIAIIDTGSVPNLKLIGFYVLPFWATILCSAVLFGIVLCPYANLVKVIATAGIGAYGLVAGIFLLMTPPANWIFAIAGSVSFLVGVFAQHVVRRYRARGSVGRRES